MELEGQVYALITLFCTAGLVGLFFGPWQSYCVDRARYELFLVRDRLFKLGEDKTISFQSPEYLMIRSSIEALIRFAHEINIWRIIVYFYILGVKDEHSASSDIMNALEGIEDPELKNELHDIRRDVAGIVKRLMYRRSLTMLCLFKALKFGNSMLRAHRKLQPLLSIVVDSIVYRADHEQQTDVRDVRSRSRHVAAS